MHHHHRRGADPLTSPVSHRPPAATEAPPPTIELQSLPPNTLCALSTNLNDVTPLPPAPPTAKLSTARSWPPPPQSPLCMLEIESPQPHQPQDPNLVHLQRHLPPCRSLCRHFLCPLLNLF
jgi:hypothetical protein